MGELNGENTQRGENTGEGGEISWKFREGQCVVSYVGEVYIIKRREILDGVRSYIVTPDCKREKRMDAEELERRWYVSTTSRDN